MNLHLIKNFLQDTRYLWKRYILTSCISLVMIITGLFLPLIMKMIIDQGIYKKNIRKIVFYVLLYFGLVLIQSLSMYISNIQYTLIGKIYNVETKKKVFETIKMFDGKDIQNEQSGKLMHTIEEDIDNISMTVTDVIFQIIYDIFTAIFSFFILLYISPLILIIILLIQSILFFINKYLSNRLNKLNQEQFSLRDEQGSNLQEFLVNLDYILENNIIDYFSEKYIRKEEKLTQTTYNINKTMTLNFCYQNILNTITKCMIWGIGGILIITKKITIGNVYIVETYAGKLAAPIYRIIDSSLELKKTFLEIERVYTLLNRDYEEKKTKYVDLYNKAIVFQNVYFSYDSKSKIFEGLNMNIYPNQVNVLIGKSGQGKTTMIKLLTQMWEANSGKILINTTSLYEYSKFDLRNQISVVSQNVPIFNATIMENIVLSNQISIDEIVQTCKLTGIYDEIMTKKDKFNTVITEYGRNLSGGQKQRIAITRAILKKANVIILDEPTASLDSENREQIRQLLYSLKDKTIILITHDDELVKYSENIYLLKDGKAICNKNQEIKNMLN